MRCEDCQILFIGFLYDELEDEDAARLKEHLQICESCRREFDELSQTSVLLHAWPDEDPGASLVFVRESSGLLSSLRQLVWPAGASLGRKLVAGFSTVAIAALAMAALLNFEFSNSEGRMNLRLGLWPRSAATQELDVALVERLREQNLEMINQVLSANRQQQREEMTRTLAQFAQQMNRQRENDLVLVGRGLELVQQKADSRFQRTNEVLNSLIRTTAYQPQR